MAHVQDRWWQTVKDTHGNPVFDDRGKSKKEKTSRYGKGSRYKVRYHDTEGNERSKGFPDGSLKKAQEFKAKLESGVLGGEFTAPKSQIKKIRDFVEEWISDLDVDALSRQTIEMRFRRNITPHIGEMYIDTVQPSTIRTWDRKLREKELSERYRMLLFDTLSAMFTAAVDDGIISKNPCSGKSVKKPRPTKRKIVPWSAEDVWKVQDNLPEKFRIAVDICAGLGLRQGECFGLALEDIDLDAGMVHVRRQVKKINYKHVFARPKYGKVREIPLPQPVQDALERHIKDFPPKKITLPWASPEGKSHTATLIMTSAWGKVVDAKDFNKDRWKPALKASGLAHGRNENGMHDLRHFYASMLLDQGESIKAVSEWLGHGDPSFTLKTYTHLMPSSGERTRKVIDGLYSNKRSPSSEDGDSPDDTLGGPGTAQSSI